MDGYQENHYYLIIKILIHHNIIRPVIDMATDIKIQKQKDKEKCIHYCIAHMNAIIKCEYLSMYILIIDNIK